MLVKFLKFVSALDNKINRIKGEMEHSEQDLALYISNLNELKNAFENFSCLIIEYNASGIVSRLELSEQQRMIAVLVSKQENVYQEMLVCRSHIVALQDILEANSQEILTIEKRKFKIERFITKIRKESLTKKLTVFENEIEEQVAYGYSSRYVEFKIN